MSKKQIIATLVQPHVKAFLKKYGIFQVALFGSYARNEATKHSDVDLLYIQDKKTKIGLEFFDIVQFLEKILQKKVDFIEISSLHRSLKKHILADKIDIL